ncbi:MAG: lamin tail domain-containing protein [Bacteroidales bacterium]|nr:lamin tail domain-containing protein [Bacteroidales bacterium]
MKKTLLTTLIVLFGILILNAQKILFDATKAESAGSADWVIDADAYTLRYYSSGGVDVSGNEATAQQTPTLPQSGINVSTVETYWNGAISEWGVELVKLGYDVETLPWDGAITFGDAGNTQDLSNYDVFIVCEPNIPFTAAEKTAILNFVSNGGGLFMVSDHGGAIPADRNGDGWNSTDVWNDLMSGNPFGMTFDDTDVSVNPASNLPTLPGDPLLHGSAGDVSDMAFYGSATMTISSAANSTVLGIVFNNGESTSGSTGVLVAYAEYGSGRVVALGDSSPADDGTSNDSDDALYDNWADYDNSTLILNATIWLAENTIKPEPDNHTTNFVASDISDSQIDVSWTDAVGSNLPDGYLILANLTGTFTNPVDGTDPSVDTDLSDGSAVIKVLHGSKGNYSFTGLDPETQYFFKIWSYSNSGSNIDYKIDIPIPTDDATTRAPLATTCEDFNGLNETAYGNYDYNDFHINNGLCDDTYSMSGNAVRLRNAAGSYLELVGSDGNGVDGGVGDISFWYRNWDGSPAAVYDVSANIDGGGYATIGTINTTSTNFLEFTYTLNNGSDNIKIKITNTSGERLYIDDFCYSNYSAGGPEVDWCNVQSPASGSIRGGNDFNVYTQVYEPSVTEAAGQGAGITAWIGYSTVNNDPETNPGDWTWVAASYNTDSGNNDEYFANIGPSLTGGTYYYSSRFQLSGGAYKYGGYNVGGGGFWDGSANVSGALTVDDVVDWCNIQSPANGTVNISTPTFNVYAQVWEDGYTNPAGQAAHVNAWIGYSSVDNDPVANPGDWTWVAMSFNTQSGNNDEYVLDLGTSIGAGGTYYYVSRFQIGSGDYYYGGYNGGFWTNTYTSGSGNKSGRLIILEPRLTVSPTSLTGYTYIEGSGPSASQSFDLSGADLDGTQVTIMAPTNYEVSLDDASFGASVNVSYTAPTLNSTTIYVRLKAGLSAGTYNSENVTCDDNGSASDKIVENNGEVTAPSAGGCASDLFISEYCEGSSNNKYIEIYNGTGATIDFSSVTYTLRQANAGGSWGAPYTLSGTLADGAVFILANTSANGTILAAADDTEASVTAFNGDDAVGLFKEGVLIDIVGNTTGDPGTGWNVAGVSAATANHTLVRKPTITDPQTDWPTSAGTDASNSEWVVNAQDDFSDIGSHTMNCNSPTLNVTPTSLTGYTYVFGSGPSGSQSFELSGTNLDGTQVTVTAPTNYEISLDDATFSANFNVSYTVPDLASTTIYVRLKAGLPVGLYNSELVTCSDDGTASDVNVSNDGEVTAIPVPTLIVDPSSLSGLNYTFGFGPSASQSFEVSGTDLDGSDVTLTAPADYEISTDDASFSGSITLSSFDGTATTIYVRLKASLAIGTYNGETITVSGGGDSSDETVTCDGQVTDPASACASELIISEYYEGASNDKYIEIFNGSSSAINLGGYKISLYANGSTSATDISLDAVDLAANDAYIIANSSSNASILTNADQTSGSLGFNGNDAIALRTTADAFIDVIGVVGTDPGSEWGSGLTSTADNMLIRKSSIVAGDANESDAFDPSTEWNGYANGDYSNMGIHTMTCTCEEPTTEANNLVFTNVSDIDMDLSWTSGDGVSRIVVAKAEVPVDWEPVDGTTYTANSSFGSGTEMGTGNYVVYNGSGNGFSVTNLIPGTTYYFKIFEYGCTPGTEDYLTSGTPEEGNETTLPNNISDLSVICATASTIDVSWTLPTGNYDAILITVLQGGTPDDPSCEGSSLINPVTDYSSADIYCANASSAVYVFNDIGTNVSISGLTSGLSYTIKAFVYINSSWSNGISVTKTAEVSDVTNLQASCGNTTSQVGWNNPNSACFDDVIIIASDASITATPAGDGSTYTANPLYGGGTDIGTNEFVVYKGTGELVDITGLTNNTTYYFKAFVRSGTDWSAGVEVSCMPSTAVVLNYGDLAIVGINTDITGLPVKPDEIQFVCFVDVTTGTSIDFTDNGYERETAGEWGDGEGTLRFTRTGADLPAGTIITIQGLSSSATPTLGVDYDVFVCGVNDNGNWSVSSLNLNGPYDLNVNDQIWMMQGGVWNDDGNHSNDNASYSGNVLYGWTATGWKPAPGYDDTKGSTIYPGAECATTDVAGKTFPDKVRYTGPTGITSQIGWIGRFNDPGNWTDFADNPTYFAGGSLPCVIPINYAVVSSKWTGVTNTDWNNCANWNSLKVPDATTDVEFENDNCFNDIVILSGENAVCRNMTINGAVASYFIKLEGDATKVLDIRGDLTINAEALDLDDGNSAVTDGTIILFGDWINNLGTDGFIEGNSTIEFNASTDQNINTVDATEDFANITINNNSTNGVVLNNSITTADNLLLNSGLLSLNGSDITINGQYSRNSGFFAGNSASNIDVQGAGTLAAFYFSTPQQLNSFTINRGGEIAALATNLTMSDMLIDAGTIQLNAGKFFTVSNTITNNVGTTGLLLKSNATGTASLIHYTENVPATCERYIAGGVWGYIFPPLSAVSEGILGGSNPNFYYYDEATADYWDAINIYEPMGWQNVPGGALATSRGYIVYHPATQIYNLTGGNMYFDATSRNKIFTTTYTDSGSGSVNLNGVTADWNDFEGWNLFGNPYTAAIDWDKVNLSNVEEVVYYYDGAASNYKYYGTGTSYDQGITVNGGSQFVPANQAFFVKATVNGGTVTIPDNAREHNGQDFWKNHSYPNDKHIDIVRLKIDFDEYSDETVVKLDSNATDFHDLFDGYKMFSPVKEVPQIFTIDNASSNYSINYSAFEPIKVIPIGVFIKNEGNYSIYTDDVNMGDYHVYLKDNETNTTTNLQNTSSYSFDFEGGLNTERFELWLNLNTAPYSVLALENQSLYTNETLSYSLPEAFADADMGDYLTISASLEDGNDLPDWLTFEDGTFAGTPSEVQTVNVKVTATDKFGANTSQIFTITVLSTVDINKIPENQIMIYPNPAENFVVIKITNVISETTIKIIDISGKIVFETNQVNNINTIDISNLAKGVYLVEIRDDVAVETQKLIIK